MKIVIDIDEEKYYTIKKHVGFYTISDWVNVCRAVQNGTPLPKGHGRLIDADDINNHIVGHIDTRDCPTIIEADKAGKEFLLAGKE